MFTFVAEWFSKLYRLLVPPEADGELVGSFLNYISTIWFDRVELLERQFGISGNVAQLSIKDPKIKETIKDLLGVTVDVQELGKGSFGLVYKCRDSWRRQFALKVMSPTFDDEGYLKNFFLKLVKQEIYHTGNLQHDNIVRMYDSLILDRPFHTILKLELMGPNLDKLAKLTPLNMKIIQKIVKEIGSAIKYIHSEGTAHHDIKLENIMVSSKIDSVHPRCINKAIAKQKLKLADFGLARKYFTDPPVEVKFRSGSPPYRSPEKLDASRYDPFKSDDYAFGCTLAIAYIGWKKFVAERNMLKKNSSQTLWDTEDRLIMAKFAEKLFNNSKGNKNEMEAIIGLLECDPNRRLTIDQIAAVFE